jgi:hypothetical protein
MSDTSGRDPIEVLVNVLVRAKVGITVLYGADIDMIEWMIGEVEILAAPGSDPVRTHDVDEALTESSRLVLLVPANEREAVFDLDAGRSRLDVRSQPIVLFLLRYGDAHRALLSLGSWIGDVAADPDAVAEIDVSATRATFERDVGQTPEVWLAAWRSRMMPRDSRGFRRAFLAMLLERQDQHD